MNEEVILTSIEINNIPFALRKERLVELMTEMQLPLPYALNYHFDNGVFRNRAFANFITQEHALIVINALNNYALSDFGGRKLRVNYKKVFHHNKCERMMEKVGKEQCDPMDGLLFQSRSGSVSSQAVSPMSSSPIRPQSPKPGLCV